MYKVVSSIYLSYPLIYSLEYLCHSLALWSSAHLSSSPTAPALKIAADGGEHDMTWMRSRWSVTVLYISYIYPPYTQFYKLASPFNQKLYVSTLRQWHGHVLWAPCFECLLGSLYSQDAGRDRCDLRRLLLDFLHHTSPTVSLLAVSCDRRKSIYRWHREPSPDLEASSLYRIPSRWRQVLVIINGLMVINHYWAQEQLKADQTQTSRFIPLPGL